MGTSAGATYQFQLLPVKAGGQEKRWVKTKPFQHHTHDVRAVVHTPTALISGGEGCVGKLHGCSPFPPVPPLPLFSSLPPLPPFPPLPPPPIVACMSSTWFPGLDAQLVIRPLMEKVQKKGYDTALRKFTLPHVSVALSRVLWWLLGP